MSRYKKSRRGIITPQGAFVVAAIVIVLLLASMIKAAGDSQAAEAVTIDSTANLEYVVLPPATSNDNIAYTGFTVGFNPDKHQPNYVAWTLTAEHTDGPHTRKGVSFMPDPDVEGSAQLADYRNSGFDRGHMAPAADMKWSRQAMTDCHYLTNICPQSDQLNGKAWAKLESMTRAWAQRFGRVVIVAGPVLTDRLTRTIGATGIPVPERFYKVILAPDADPPMGIAFIMPNGYVSGGVQQTAASIDQVETITGIDFFPALPDDIENRIEAQNSLAQWTVH